MRERSNRSASLFLIEMIVVLFFFAISAAVCARLFVLSHRMKQQSAALTNAVTRAQNAAELFYAYQGDIDAMTSLLPEDVHVTAEREGDFFTGSVFVVEGDDVLFELPLKCIAEESE